jgi:flavin reductase (DIM6/NTAB) family NADH-FMN oxidoreductase RutF/DNA-binding GntR family transcriptional regulator
MSSPHQAVGPDQQHFRHVVGHLASGVTVITTRTGESLHGMTASSVTSLSLEPPMMLACLNRSAPTAHAVSAAGRYAVNVLGQEQPHLAQQFAAPSTDKFRGVGLLEGHHQLPLLADALAHIECEVVEEITGGTHSIFVGRVIDASAGQGQPLTYYRGGFGRFEFARDDAVYQRARTQVLERQWAADAVLHPDDLARDLDVDPSSAFYALTRLAADGLVQRDPARGYVVTPFDVATSDATFDARSVIELGVIQLTADRLAPDATAELRRRFEQMAALLVGERFIDFDRYLDANYAFHEYLVSLADSPALTVAFGSLSIKTVMTRSFGATPVTSQDFVEAQRQITEGMEKRDAAMASTGVLRYTDLAKARVREILSHTGGHL